MLFLRVHFFILDIFRFLLHFLSMFIALLIWNRCLRFFDIFLHFWCRITLFLVWEIYFMLSLKLNCLLSHYFTALISQYEYEVFLLCFLFLIFLILKLKLLMYLSHEAANLLLFSSLRLCQIDLYWLLFWVDIDWHLQLETEQDNFP